MRIFLADLAHTKSVDVTSLTVPLNISYLKAHATAALGNEIDVRLFKDPEKLLAACFQEPPRVIGLSNYGWNVKLNQTIGAYLKRTFPEIVIAAGGPNIYGDENALRSHLARHSYLDYLVVGAGEQPFTALLAWLRAGSDDLSSLPANVACLRNAVTFVEKPPQSKEIRDVPSPYLAGYLDEFLSAGMVPLFESNRGCPFGCTFCAWGSAAHNLVRKFGLDVILAEIDYVSAHSRAPNWIFCDANFGILKRDVEIAHAIRKVKDSTGFPQRCIVWQAKNTTERSLEIAAILEEMAVPVMAVQSLTPGVLANIRRKNISTDSYVEYQRRFHALGRPTYSDMIVPLPGETLASHLDGLARLFDYGVDDIQVHNMRLLPGAETNSVETRARYGFRTRYRLIHGDAGAYRAPGGAGLFCFEYEESLRATNSISEDDLFYLRKLHFLVEFAWNIRVYRPLLAWLAARGINQTKVLQAVIERAGAEDGRVAEMFRRLDQFSRNEWFDTPGEIEAHFAEPPQQDLLLAQELDKLNILFSVVLLKEYKTDFDAAFARLARGLSHDAGPELDVVLNYCFALFPPLDSASVDQVVNLPGGGAARLVESPRRTKLRSILADRSHRHRSLSKILNTLNIRLSDLRLDEMAPAT